MLDLFYIFTAFAFFALCWGLAKVCERLWRQRLWIT